MTFRKHVEKDEKESLMTQAPSDLQMLNGHKDTRGESEQNKGMSFEGLLKAN